MIPSQKKYGYVGTHYSCVAPAGYSEPVEALRELRSAFGWESFRPLWATIVWKDPIEGDEITCVNHVLGRYNPTPHSPRHFIHNLVLPTTNYLGIEWRQPIFEDDVLDGLSDAERSAGVLPRYQPFDSLIVSNLRFGRWLRENVPVEHKGAELAEFQAQQDRIFWDKKHEEFSYRRKHDSRRLREAAAGGSEQLSTAGRMVVPSRGTPATKETA